MTWVQSRPACWHQPRCWPAVPGRAPRWWTRPPGAEGCIRFCWAGWHWHHGSPAHWPQPPDQCNTPHGALCSQRHLAHRSKNQITEVNIRMVRDEDKSLISWVYVQLMYYNFSVWWMNKWIHSCTNKMSILTYLVKKQHRPFEKENSQKWHTFFKVSIQ